MVNLAGKKAGTILIAAGTILATKGQQTLANQVSANVMFKQKVSFLQLRPLLKSAQQSSGWVGLADQHENHRRPHETWGGK